MNIKFNGEIKEIREESLNGVISAYLNGKEPRGIAVALNASIVPKQKWDETILNENDEVEVVHAVQGG